MPFKSKAQAAYFNIHKKELESKGVNVDEWNAASKGKKLPKRAPKIKKKVKGYATGGVTDLSKLTPDQLAQYNALTSDADKAQFMDNIGGTLADASNINSVVGGAAKVAPIAAGLIEASRGGSHANNELNRTAEGALAGAGTGASIGSIIPGVGTAIGAGVGTLVGGIGGFLKGKKEQEGWDADAKAKADADAKAKKLAQDAAAKANMNPWDVGYGMKDGGVVSVAKAKIILKDGTIRGKALTKAQKGYFGLIAGGGTPNKAEGGTVITQDNNPLTASLSTVKSTGNIYSYFPRYINGKASYFKVAGPNISAAEYAKTNRNVDSIPTGNTIPITEEEFMKAPKEQMLYGKLAGDYPTTADKPYYDAVTLASFATPSKVSSANIPQPKADGGEVEIKPSERGTFTEAATKHKMGVQEFAAHVMANKEDYSTAMIKKATFAHNFAGKADGGMVMEADIKGAKNVQAKTDGGEIEGAGTAKSDSIKAKVAPKSFIVPAENAGVAEMLRKMYLGQNTKTADVKQSDGKRVNLSNGEHLFTPEEKTYLEKMGVNMNALAPNANDEAKEGTNYRTIGNKKGGEVKGYSDGTTGNGTDFWGDTQKEYDAKQLIGPTEKAANNLTDSYFEKPTDKTIVPSGGSGNRATDYLPALLGVGQAALGATQLIKNGARPVDQLDPQYAAAIAATQGRADRAQKEAAYGLTPEERQLAQSQIEGNRQTDVANIINQAGGSGGTALANIRQGSVQANAANADLNVKDNLLKQEKQRYADSQSNYVNNLIGNQTEMKRRLFADKMAAFQQNQEMGAGLLGTGIENIIGAKHYADQQNNQQDLLKYGLTPEQIAQAYFGASKGIK